MLLLKRPDSQVDNQPPIFESHPENCDAVRSAPIDILPER
jgi:hypothetical protein